MKISINKSAKRVLSIALALVMLVGTLFTANVGVNINANAETAVASNYSQWNGNLDTELAGGGTEGDPYLITSAAELAAVCYGQATGATSGSYFKVSGVNEFYMDSVTEPATVKALSSSSDVKTHYSAFSDAETQPVIWNPDGATVNLKFDGNGSAVYGLYMIDTKNAGLFSKATGATEIKNIAVKNSYASYSDSTAYADGHMGLILGYGGDSGSTINIKSCIIMNNFADNQGGYSGEVVGHTGNSKVIIEACLAVGNDFTYKYGDLPFNYFVRTKSVAGEIKNSVGIGAVPQFRATTTDDVYTNNYVDNATSFHTDSPQAEGVSILAAAEMTGTAAKDNMPNLNWATNAANGEGYWHLMYSGYPLPIKPDGWEEIIVQPVWSGEAADFTKGSGTEADPYIIENAEQLYQMVLDGGKLSDGTAAHYKVAPDVTDLYLNNVQGGDLETLKSLVNAGTANNWTKAFSAETYKQDSDSDGLCDEKQAFTGVFDGNGVTIHGLYSTNNGLTANWMAWGTGFVPAVKYNAVIKNVNFDKSYIDNQSTDYAGVITCSTGLDTANGGDCSTTHASFYNIAVRNTYMTTGAYNVSGQYSKGGLVASHGAPGSLNFVNCLYDGEGSELNYDTNYTDYTAGIYMTCNTASTVTMVNCVSIGVQPLTCSQQASKANLVGCYTTDTTITDYNASDGAIGISEYDSTDDLPLLNWGIWSIVTVEDGRLLPMPGVTSSTISGYGTVMDMILEQVGGAGNYNYAGAHPKGTYGHYHKLIGSGTEEDPYLITNALQLANAIATGGVNVTQTLHYKLTNDINLGSLAWIDTETVYNDSEGFNIYQYVPFQGVLDGNGYTIYELNAIVDGTALIPELNGGTVKNLHIRNSAAKTAIFGTGAGNVINCSAVDCYVSDGTDALVSGGATVSNCHFNDTYYLEDGTQGVPAVDGTVWYQSGGEDCKPQLVNRADAMPCADVDGDGQGYEYAAADVAALRNKLLGRSGYDYTYGDVSNNGKVNISDLVILTRAASNTYDKIEDGFWRNLELGKIKIYYGENDNYDAARKLELYLEGMVPDVDIIKAVSAENVVSGETSDKTAVYRHANDIEETPDGELEIIVGNIANYDAYAANTLLATDGSDVNNYAIYYDAAKCVVWLQGGSFTGVEQAVIDFVKKSDPTASYVHSTTEKQTLDPDKVAVDINSDGIADYYYAWGDEFGTDAEEDSILKSQLNEDNWVYSKMGTETVSAEKKYLNLETAFNEDFAKLYAVEDGKLSIKRGVYGGTETSDWGYVNLDTQKTGTNAVGDVVESDDKYVSAGLIDGQNSLLVKQGYFEFKASLPSDGHSFASWWMMGDPSGGNNNSYSQSLYGKVYKLNPNYDETINTLDSSNAGSTYKYQLPNSYFEIDIIELMQDISCLEGTTAFYNGLTKIYEYELPLNLHKYFTTGVTNNTYYLNTWNADGTVTRGDSYTVDNSDGHTLDGIFSIRRVAHDFGNKTNYVYNETSQNKLTKMRRYGFEWEVTTNSSGVGQSFEYTLYIWDTDGDGIETDDADDGLNNGDGYDLATYSFTDITYNESSDLATLDNALSNAVIANQYMHFIIDNTYYSSNQHYDQYGIGWSTSVELFTDLLDQTNTLDKATMEIEYLRVYQADGRRDIVTPETEAFNNGNHFGY